MATDKSGAPDSNAHVVFSGLASIQPGTTEAGWNGHLRPKPPTMRTAQQAPKPMPWNDGSPSP